MNLNKISDKLIFKQLLLLFGRLLKKIVRYLLDTFFPASSDLKS